MKTGGFETIKDPKALQEYLQKYTSAQKTKNSTPAESLRKQTESAEYKGLDATKSLKSETASVRPKIEKNIDSDDETRSVKAEIDYKSKDAARFIVAEQKNKQKLQDKIISNLDSIKGKALSQKSFKSIASRVTNTTARRITAVVNSPSG